MTSSTVLYEYDEDLTVNDKSRSNESSYNRRIIVPRVMTSMSLVGSVKHIQNIPDITRNIGQTDGFHAT